MKLFWERIKNIETNQKRKKMILVNEDLTEIKKVLLILPVIQYQVKDFSCYCLD